ncbi:gliding motility-associated C-terminal domain-containing protein [Hydrotalea flava]|uniref:gliding motility-associated C-terminal domain-containing protein n=1 Tax=Hydrotalea flava TaxID=714549 RepID=UPI00142EE7AB|nr:gliding motility-associated C-terminal domain-containing protein [Hydrotalea flava]
MNKYFTLSFLLVVFSTVLLGFAPSGFFHVHSLHNASSSLGEITFPSFERNTSVKIKPAFSNEHNPISFSFDSAIAPFSCPAKLIVQKDTTICKGDTVTLTAIKPVHVDSEPPGVWVLLISGNNIDQTAFNLKAYGYDKVNQYLYSIINKRIIRYDLKNKTSTEIFANNWPGWPGNYTEFTYDYTNNRLILWRAGTDNVYAVPATGGAWTQIGNGAFDNADYNASSYWNPITNSPGFYGGYGGFTVKNWIYENNLSWIQKRPNLSDCNPPKGGNLMGTSADGKTLFLFSGQGSCDGNELSGTCSLGSPWATANGMFCWLKDLYALDLNTYTFTNILPTNNSTIQYEGAMTYDYDKNRFYLFGGFQPTGDYPLNQYLVNTKKTFRFNWGTDNGFSEFVGTGAVPPAAPLNASNGYAYYDPVDKRVIWARIDGIWAYYPDSSLIKQPKPTLVWSTGDTTTTIKVYPSQTTTYSVTYTDSPYVCKDQVTIKVDALKTLLAATTTVCNDTSKVLNAGTGFTSYLWSTGDTTASTTVDSNGVYKVKVTDSICTVTDSTKVQFATSPKPFTIQATSDTVCPGTADTLSIVNPETGVNYNWYKVGNNTLLFTGTSYTTQPISQATNYVVLANTNPPICAATNASIGIQAASALSTPVVQADTITANSVLFSWLPVPGAVSYLISLDNGATFQLPAAGLTALEELVTGLGPNQTINFKVKALGKLACQESAPGSITVTTLNPIGDAIFIPNSFTPNGDGNNDLFFVYGNTIKTMKLSIYNQWGQLIFYTSTQSQGWNGSYNGTKMPVGVYYYSFEATLQSNEKVKRRGSITLIR